MSPPLIPFRKVIQFIQQGSEDEFHGMAHAIVDVFKANDTADVRSPLVQIYEKCRCSLCRQGAVTVLMRHQNAPAWMLAECRHDSNPAIRNLISG